MLKRSCLVLFGLASLLAGQAYAQPAVEHVVVASSCLLKNTNAHYKTLAEKNNFTLLTTDTNGIYTLAAEKGPHATACGGFVDVTRKWKNSKQRAAFLTKYLSVKQTTLATKTKTYNIKYSKQVNQLLAQLNPQNIWDDLTVLTNFHDRYAYSKNGKKAAEWLKTQITTLAKNNNRDDITTYYVETNTEDENYIQPSLVVKIGNSTQAAVVIGAHMDSTLKTNGSRPSPNDSAPKSPGADDNGSGTATLLEVARVLINTDMRFKNPIYLIWYAAEEEGLFGSANVVDDFVTKKIPVSNVLQLDMIGYEYKNQSTIWLMSDNTNKGLTAFVDKLVTTYTQQTTNTTSCGYPCSDNYNWDRQGFPVAFPVEAKMGQDNPDWHTSNDTMDKLTLTHMADFAKLGTAFAVELAEPTTK